MGQSILGMARTVLSLSGEEAPVRLGAMARTVLLAGLLVSPMQAPATAGPAELTVSGTLQTIVRSSKAGSVEIGVLTGIGHALRVVKCTAEPATPIMRKGKSARLADLQAGEILRMRYRPSAEGNRALEIEVVSLGDDR